MQVFKACESPLRALTSIRPDIGHLGREHNSRLLSASPRCFSGLHQPFTARYSDDAARHARHRAHHTMMATEQSTSSTVSSEEARDDDVRSTSFCAVPVPDHFISLRERLRSQAEHAHVVTHVEGCRSYQTLSHKRWSMQLQQHMQPSVKEPTNAWCASPLDDRLTDCTPVS